MPKYADVSLPVSVDREFTYLVPPALQESVSVGVRVVVPLGRKFATGLVVGLPDVSTVRGLKPIRDVLDASPLVSTDLLRLCRWVSEYYLAPLGDVLRAANPGAFTRPSRRSATLLRTLTDPELARIQRRSPKRERILRTLADHGTLTSPEIERLAGLTDVNPALNELERAGLISTEEIISTSGSAVRTALFISRDSVRADEIVTRLERTPTRSVRRRELLASILRMTEQSTEDFPVSSLLQRSGATRKALLSLADQGLFALVPREVRRRQDYGTEEQTLGIILNRDQQNALSAILASLGSPVRKPFLLHGVTGSGKTQVYIECIRHVLAKGRSAIVLVPEISLTPQIVRRFQSHFADLVAVVHSRMSIAERREVWKLAQRGTAAIVIGPRSAIFAPLKNLGLIVVDEEHEATYKQFDAMPRYHARDVAIVRGAFEQALVLLGSATPSVESYDNALRGKYALLELPQRIDDVPMPAIAVVDMTAERKRLYAAMKESLPQEERAKLKSFQQPGISAILQEKIRDRLQRQEGIILLQNRRGFAPFVECPDCGYTETCENCNVTLTYHITHKHLRCHYCGLVRQPYIICPSCGSTATKLHGIGTQKVEEDLARMFPEARIIRMDLDTTTTKGSHDRLLRRFGNRDADILLGTQMVAKGLDFPHVTLVGVISADTQMLLPDFRSAERTFQLLTQVAGRAGRSTLLGEVIIQTYQPKNFTLAHVIDHNFRAFYDQELEERRELEYPPFSRLVLLEAKGRDEGKVRRTAESIAAQLSSAHGFFTVLGPAPAVIGKIRGEYRWHIIVKNMKSSDPGGSRLRELLHGIQLETAATAQRTVRLIVDVDPVTLM